MALSLAYAGSKGVHLPGPDQQLNQLPSQFLALGSQLQDQVANPFFGQVSLGTLSKDRVAQGQLLRPYAEYTGFSMKNPTNRNSIYHSGQLKLEKRFGVGGTVLGAYTWSKLISDTDTITGWLEAGGGAGGVQDNYNIRAERSLALYDTPHRAVISYIVDLPFGKGHMFGANTGGFTSRMISGWGINGITTFQSGNPLPIGVSANTTNSFGGGQRPNRTLVPIGNRRVCPVPHQWVVQHRGVLHTCALYFRKRGPKHARYAFPRNRKLRFHGFQKHSDHRGGRYSVPYRSFQSLQSSSICIPWNHTWDSSIRYCQRSAERSATGAICVARYVLEDC